MAAEQEIFCRTEGEIHVLSSGTSSLETLHTHSGDSSGLVFSPDGTLFALTTPSGVAIHDTASRTLRHALPSPGTLAASFSPDGRFLLTQARPAKDVDQDRNLKLWGVEDGAVRLALHQKHFRREEWPAIRFGVRDALAYYQVTSAVHVYDTSNFSNGVTHRVPIKGVSSFAPRPSGGGGALLAAYCPEAKGSPASVGLYSAEPGADGTPICRKNFFRSNSAQLLWSPSGCAVLALAASDVDATNQSYYGEQKLYFMASNGQNECAVQLPKEGPIHDVQWSPKGNFFLVVAGFMPAKVILFNSACVPKFDLGSGPFSMVRWNPFGRYFVLAGFGNLPGDLAFYDKKADGKCKPMGTTRAENGVALEWSPCGHMVLVSTTAPRLRVDNGIQVFRADAARLAARPYPILLQAAWRPAAPGSFSDAPLQTPGGAAGAEPALPPPPAVTGYVPPHLRGNPAAAAAARSKFSLARDAEDRGGKITNGGVVGAPPAAARMQPALPPGAEATPELSKAAAKNAKRRAAAAKKKAEEGLGKLAI
uniref:Eukaryotic translation initiation factor 2A n=1 Tax=Auxenochlorella protothecoides TaxID=3075 RepID=A0A1D2AE34_AUXPR